MADNSMQNGAFCVSMQQALDVVVALSKQHARWHMSCNGCIGGRVLVVARSGKTVWDTRNELRLAITTWIERRSRTSACLVMAGLDEIDRDVAA